jgi:hypothetical protein
MDPWHTVRLAACCLESAFSGAESPDDSVPNFAVFASGRDMIGVERIVKRLSFAGSRQAMQVGRVPSCG